MTWDDTAYKVCLCALGTVEASMNYGAVNPTDPISVGILQWYAGRAANVLNKMRTTNSADWVGVPSSLTDALIAHSSSDSFWGSKYPTAAEINALHTVMNKDANVIIQDNQAYSDIDSYLAVAANFGLDIDANTKTAEFFCNIYNRNPVGAGRIIGNCGPTSSLDRIYSYTLSDSTESALRSRYTTAYNIIKDQITTGVGAGTPGGGDGNPGGDPGNGGGGGSAQPGNASYIREIGSQLHLFNRDDTHLIFQRTAPSLWLSSFDTNKNGGDPPPSDPPPGGGGGGGTPPPTAITDIVEWLASVENNFAYSQGGGRLNPVSSGYTDCSGLLYYAYLRFAHKDIGTYTGTQCTTGTLVTNNPSVAKDGSTVKIGDCILYRWENRSFGSDPFDHTALYIGNDKIQSHGGPDNGPDIESHSGNIDSAIGNGGGIMVRRHIS